jgi:hypothetical protein
MSDDYSNAFDEQIDPPKPQKPVDGEKPDGDRADPFDDPEFLNGSKKSDGAEHAKPRRFTLTRLNKILLSTAPIYLVKGLIPAGGLIIIWGPPKCGKSFWTMDMAMHIARGVWYRGRRVRQGTVVYIALEGGLGFTRRKQAYCQEHKVENAPFYLITNKTDLIHDHRSLIRDIRAQIEDCDGSPVLVVVDTLNRSLVGSENSDEDMGKYLSAADAIREAFQCAVAVVHHCGHNDKRMRGHSSVPGALDAEIGVSRDTFNNVVTKVEHMRDGDEGDTIVSRLDVVKVGYDDDGDVMTSCVILPVETDAQPKKQPKTKHRLPKAAQIGLSALIEAVGEIGMAAPASNHIPQNAKVITLEHWREYAYRKGISASQEPRARQVAFNRAVAHLIADRHVGTWDDFVWWCGG